MVQGAEGNFYLCMDVFDPTIDEIFSVEDWRRTIETKNVLLLEKMGKL